MRSLELKHARRLTLAVLTVIVLGAGAFVTNVSAQNAGDFEIQVPFDFVVKGRTYPAARYRIGRLDRGNPDALILKSSTDKTLLIFLTQRISFGAPAEVSRLTFRRYGDTHFLDSIRASGERYESRLPSNKSDRRRSGTELASRIVSINVK